MAIYSFDLPGWRPTSVNRLSDHWAVRRRLKRLDYDTVAVFALKANVPKATGRRRVSLAITVAGPGRTPDGDNALKVTLDALVKCGLLVDDSPRWCELGGVTVERGKVRSTRITLEDVEA